MLNQPGFFDIAERGHKLTQMGDPLVALNAQINWEAFRPDLDRIHKKPEFNFKVHHKVSRT